jgi:N-acetylmuramoyl-L-alanine amidase
VTSIALTLTGPTHARYGRWVTLHASVTPRLPVTVRGRRVGGGGIRFRLLSPAPYVAFADGVRSQPLRIVVTPKLVVRVPAIATVGQRVEVRASLHPAHAGTVHASAVDTRTPGVRHVVVATTPAPGWEAARASATVTVVEPTLSVGAGGRSVLTLEQALAAQHYLVPPRSSIFSSELTDSIYAFQKQNGIARTGIADAPTWRALAHPVLARPRYTEPAYHIEVNKPQQLLYVVRGGKVAQIVPVSTAGLPGKFTPVGRFAVYRKVVGFDPSPLGTLYDPSYFTGGYAIHGNPSVPPYPASHGCVRVPMWAAPVLYAEMPYGTVVDVY